MPFALSWPAPQIALRRFGEQTNSDDLSRSFEAVMNDWRFDRLRLNVVDLTEVRAVAVDDATLETLAATVYGASITNHEMDVLIVAPPGPGRTLAERYMSVKLASYRMHLVGSHDEANAWLLRHHPGVWFRVDGSLGVPLADPGA